MKDVNGTRNMILELMDEYAIAIPCGKSHIVAFGNVDSENDNIDVYDVYNITGDSPDYTMSFNSYDDAVLACKL